MKKLMTTLQKIKSHRASVKKHRAVHREWFRSYQNEYYATHPERRAAVRERARLWRLAHKKVGIQ